MIGFLKGNQVDNHEIPSVYSKYLHDNPDDFCKTRSMAKTALYRNFHSFAYNSYEPYLQAILCQQTLLQKHLLFDLIWEKDNLADYECVILAGIECLNRTEIEEFEKYVKNGGRVVLTDSCGKYDQWHRQYPSGCFDDLKDNCAKGRLTMIPDFKMPANGPKKSEREIWDDCYPVLNDKFWLLPENADEMIAALNKNPVLLKTDASKNTIVELRKSSNGRFVLVHVINYAKAQGEIKFELNLAVKDIRHINIPDNKKPPIPCSIKNGMSCFKIKNTEIYSYLKMTLV
jgi:hypothetical protein